MEQKKNHPPLLLEVISAWLCRTFRVWKVPIVSSLVWGFLAYMFVFTNKLLNHDEVGQLFSKGATTDSGRWGLELLKSVFPNVSMPWIYGVLTVLFVAIAICLIVDLFRIKSKVLLVLLSGCIMVFPSLIGVFGYMFTSSSYGVSFLLAVLAVWLVCKGKKWLLLPGLGCLVASVSIYQAYISVAASLFVLVLIQRLLYGEEPPAVVKQGVGYVVFLILSLAGYYLATQVILHIKGVTLNGYAAGSITFSPAYLLKGVRLAYVNFHASFFGTQHRLIPTELSSKLHLLLFAVMAALLLLWMFRQKKPRVMRCLLLLVLLLLLPLAINCMYLITSEGSIHTLVLYSFVAVYILAAMLADLFLPMVSGKRTAELWRRLCLDGIALILALIVMINVYVANTSYLSMHLRYENVYAFYTSLTAQLRQMPQFQPGTTLAVIGNWNTPSFYSNEQMDFTNYLTGVGGLSPNCYSIQHFLTYYIGLPIPFASYETTSAIQQTEEFRNMNAYPYYGSIAVIDDVIVVKLSD